MLQKWICHYLSSFDIYFANIYSIYCTIHYTPWPKVCAHCLLLVWGKFYMVWSIYCTHVPVSKARTITFNICFQSLVGNKLTWKDDCKPDLIFAYCFLYVFGCYSWFISTHSILFCFFFFFFCFIALTFTSGMIYADRSTPIWSFHLPTL